MKTIGDGGTPLTNILSSSKQALISTTFPDNEIVKGNGFQVHRIFEIPSGGKKLVLDMSLLDDNFCFTLPLRMNTNEGQCWVSTYLIENYTGGTIVPISTRNTTIEHIPNAVFKDGIISADTAGNDLREYIIGTLSTRQNAGGGSGGANHIKIFGKDILVFDVENKEGSTIYLELNFNWYEV